MDFLCPLRNPALCNSLNSSQCNRPRFRTVQFLKDSGAKLRKDDVLDCDDFIRECAPCLGGNRLTRIESRIKVAVINKELTRKEHA